MCDESAPENKVIPFRSSSTQLRIRNMQRSTQKTVGSAQIAFLPKAKEMPLHCVHHKQPQAHPWGECGYHHRCARHHALCVPFRLGAASSSSFHSFALRNLKRVARSRWGVVERVWLWSQMDLSYNPGSTTYLLAHLYLFHLPL